MSLKIGTGERGTFVYDQEKKTLVRKKKVKKKIVHGVIQDTLSEPIESMATPFREKFDSKSAYRKHLKAHGFREVGEIPKATFHSKELEEKEEKERREDIEKSYYDIKYDRIPFTEKEKELHKQEERKCQLNNLPTKVKAPY